MINKTVIILKFIPGKAVTRGITFKKISNITVVKVMKYERIYETIMKYVTPCLWLLTLKDFYEHVY